MEDFSYRLKFENGDIMVIRELQPKDMYVLKIWKEELGEDSMELLYRLLCRTVVHPKSKCRWIKSFSQERWQLLITWFARTVVNGKVISIEDWLEMAFYLMKERWSSDLDWLESQPMPKIQYMAQVIKRHASRLKSKS